MSRSITKLTTGLTGLHVVDNPHKVLAVLYKKTLDILNKMPQEAAYRKNTTVLIEERLKIVNSQPDVTKLEQTMNGGQAEELIKQAQRELNLSRRMLNWKPWEPLSEQAPKNQWKWPI